MSAGKFLNNPKAWVRDTLSELGEGLYERENTLALTLLTVLSGQSVFLYGPPGTAKSLIARRISCVFDDAEYFEYLMQRFSTPEDVFGPVSISELKKDNYVRKTENYLPTADIAFLDEIWKSSPAILNTLLTIINERKFKNGSKVEDVPLKAIIAASNEFPSKNGGLDALYDRFVMRLVVEPMTERDSFELMISDNSIGSKVTVGEPLTQEDWRSLMDAANRVHLSTDVLDAINHIRERIAAFNKLDDSRRIYVSDRRWQKAVFVLKTASILSGRGTSSPADALVLKNCLWSDPADRPVLDGFIEEAVTGVSGGVAEKYNAWKTEFTKLEHDARDTCRPTSKVYKKPVTVNDIGCYPLELNNGPNGMKYTVYVPFGPKKAGEKYTAFGRENSRGRTEYAFKVISCDGVEAEIRFDTDSETHTVPLNPNQTEVPSDVVFTFRKKLADLRANLEDILDVARYNISSRYEEFESPFVDEKDMVRIFNALNSEFSEMEKQVNATEELKNYLDSYAA